MTLRNCSIAPGEFAPLPDTSMTSTSPGRRHSSILIFPATRRDIATVHGLSVAESPDAAGSRPSLVQL